MIFQCLNFFHFLKVYPSKINTNEDISLKIFIFKVSAILNENLKEKGLKRDSINHYKQFAIILYYIFINIIILEKKTKILNIQ